MAGTFGSLVLSLTLAGSAGAAVVFEDKFVDGGTNNGTDLLDANWVVVANTGTITPQTDTTTGPNEGGAETALQFAPSAFAGIGGTFASTTINVGETMRLSFDARFTGTPTDNSGGFRFGLYNTNGGTTGTGSATNDFGYVIRSGSGTSAGGSFAKEVGNSVGPFGGVDILTIGKYTPAPALGTTSKNYVLELTRTNATTLSATFIINGVTYSSSLTEGVSFDDGARTRLASVSPPSNEPASGGAAYFTFDQVLIGTGNITSTFRVDNIKVEVVPEPASLAVLSLAALALGGRQRRR